MATLRSVVGKYREVYREAYELTLGNAEVTSRTVVLAGAILLWMATLRQNVPSLAPSGIVPNRPLAAQVT